MHAAESAAFIDASVLLESFVVVLNHVIFINFTLRDTNDSNMYRSLAYTTQKMVLKANLCLREENYDGNSDASVQEQKYAYEK